MAVLIEGISVLISRTSLDAKFPGGWDGFISITDDETFCMDDYLVRIGFMDPNDALLYIEKLEFCKLTHIKNNLSIDIALVDQHKGFNSDCDWAIFDHVYLDKEETQNISICLSVDDNSNKLGLPKGWEYEESLTKHNRYISKEELAKEFKLLSRENGVDIYHNLQTGKKSYIASPRN